MQMLIGKDEAVLSLAKKSRQRESLKKEIIKPASFSSLKGPLPTATSC